MRSIRSLGVLALLAVLAPWPAWAQSESDKATARELWQAGESKLGSHDYKGAENDFRRANALFHAPTILLGLARAQAAQGRFVEAWENYNTIILENVTAPPAFASALADAQKEISGVVARRGKVTITVTGTDSPKVTIDDAPVKVEGLGVPRFIDPGAHVIKASADGYLPATQSVTIAEGGSQSVSLALAKGASAPVSVVVGPVGPNAPQGADSSQSTRATSGGSWMKTTGFVALGVGGAGLIEGIITGVVAIGKHGDLAKACPSGTCASDESSAVGSYHTVGALSTVGFIVGALGTAGGTVLILTAPGNSSAPSPHTGFRVVPYVGFGSAGAEGSF